MKRGVDLKCCGKVLPQNKVVVLCCVVLCCVVCVCVCAFLTNLGTILEPWGSKIEPWGPQIDAGDLQNTLESRIRFLDLQK